MALLAVAVDGGAQLGLLCDESPLEVEGLTEGGHGHLLWHRCELGPKLGHHGLDDCEVVWQFLAELLSKLLCV